MAEVTEAPRAAGNLLTRKYAGVPGFVILLVVAGGVFIYLRYRSSSSSSATGSTDPNASGGDTGSPSPMDSNIPSASVVVSVVGPKQTPQTNPQHKKHSAGGSTQHHHSGGKPTGKHPRHEQFRGGGRELKGAGSGRLPRPTKR